MARRQERGKIEYDTRTSMDAESGRKASFVARPVQRTKPCALGGRNVQVVEKLAVPHRHYVEYHPYIPSKPYSISTAVVQRDRTGVILIFRICRRH